MRFLLCCFVVLCFLVVFHVGVHCLLSFFVGCFLFCLVECVFHLFSSLVYVLGVYFLLFCYVCSRPSSSF